MKPLIKELKENSTGLDYGCGPGPALAKMLKEKGQAHNVGITWPSQDTEFGDIRCVMAAASILSQHVSRHEGFGVLEMIQMALTNLRLSLD